MKKAVFIDTNGNREMVYPSQKNTFSINELQSYVGGLVQIVPLGKGRNLICHEEGKIIGLPKNNSATEIWNDHYPVEKYPINNDKLVVGNVLITGRKIEELISK